MKNTKKIVVGIVLALTLIIGGATVFVIDPPGSGTITIQK